MQVGYQGYSLCWGGDPLSCTIKIKIKDFLDSGAGTIYKLKGQTAIYVPSALLNANAKCSSAKSF